MPSTISCAMRVSCLPVEAATEREIRCCIAGDISIQEVDIDPAYMDHPDACLTATVPQGMSTTTSFVPARRNIVAHHTD